MPAKTPMYLKTSTPKRGKKLKLRDILSGDMISPPLGDLRHSAHVGPEGETDMFGDVGFIQGKLDLLPGMSRARSRSAERGRAENPPADKRGQQPAGTAPTLLKNTVSLPVFSPEQAPPKPPRLHLEETPPAQRSMSVSCEGPRVVYSDPELSHSASIPAFGRLVASSGSFSEASSEDSVLGVGPPLDARRGLSLDSDAGLSNEDLQSERSESPGVPNSESLLGLDLDLGPSILEDVLRIMDQYKAQDGDYEL
ncbi:cdc42 effector protein 2 [Lepisosteus oculatus]|uniref:Zgc:154093 n=1 Tax=Lepisosteus oculatus TaxID=7918 RepID=W5NM10_LEPOC|nr:PREDICTED: cdc42 effector protein 2-like [Lepisosteus oculatus]